MTETTDKTRTSTEQAPPSRGPRTGLAKWGTRAVFGSIALFAISQPFLWSWDSLFGPSIPALVTQSMAIVSVMLLMLWVVAFSQWSWTGKLLGLLPFAFLIGGLYASIRRFDPSGDVWLDPVWVWEPTQEARIAEHRAKVGETSAIQVENCPITEEDSPAYRGTHRDGVVIGPEVVTSWPEPPKPMWSQPVGGGYGSMAIVGDRLVTIEQREDNEVVVCYAASTGRELWAHKYPAKFEEAMGGPGPRSTPTIDGDLVFAQGAEGDLVCLELATGKVQWSKNLLKMFDLPNTQWGLTSSPLVVDKNVIANAGGRLGDGLVAFDIATGDLMWQGEGLTSIPVVTEEGAGPTAPATDDSGHAKVAESKQNRPGYSSPTLVTFLGLRQIINFDGMAVRGYDPETGKVVWEHPYKNDPAVNVAQPILFEDGRVFLSASYGVGSTMIQVTREGDQWKISEVWKNINLRCKFTSPILFEDHIYGLDEGIMVCIDPKTGERLWKRGRYNHGQLMLTNGILIVLTEDGRCVFVKPNPQELTELGEFQALPDNHKTWNPPTLVRGKLYARNHNDMACYDLKK